MLVAKLTKVVLLSNLSLTYQTVLKRFYWDKTSLGSFPIKLQLMLKSPSCHFPFSWLFWLYLWSAEGTFLGGSMRILGSHSPGGSTVTSSRNSSMPAIRSSLSRALYATSLKSWRWHLQSYYAGFGSFAGFMLDFVDLLWISDKKIIFMLTSSTISVAIARPISL